MDDMTDTEATLDIVELTARLGQPANRRGAVLAWTGEDGAHEWTEREAEELAGLWAADAMRIDWERDR